jgi:hypothetical protein
MDCHGNTKTLEADINKFGSSLTAFSFVAIAVFGFVGESVRRLKTALDADIAEVKHRMFRLGVGIFVLTRLALIFLAPD